MKTIFNVALFMLLIGSQNSFAGAIECFGFKNGNQEVTIGWFRKKTFTTAKICIHGNYTKMGYNQIKLSLFEAGYGAGQIGAEVNYGATLERFSAVGARFTIADGEPEPTHWEATFLNNKLISVEFERGQAVELVKVR